MSDRIAIRIRPDIRDALERFHSEQPPPMASKQDCYRHIIEDWLIGADERVCQERRTVLAIGSVTTS